MGAMALTEEVQAQLWRLLRGFVPSLGATGKVSMEKHRLASALRAAASHLEQHHGSYREAEHDVSKRLRTDDDPGSFTGGATARSTCVGDGDQGPERGERARDFRTQAAVASALEGTTGPGGHRRDVSGRKLPRGLDFSQYLSRLVALEVSYVGWDFRGLARQEGADDTIEHHVFKALRKVKLVPDDAKPEDLEYSRCGRTDKGVSALSQVMTVRVRSGARVGAELPAPGAELDYCGTMNRVLPDDIQVLGWSPVGEDFNARFSCQNREYKYHLCSPGVAPLNLERMQEAARDLVGEHDFRNFCKADPNASHFVRRVLEVDVRRVPGHPGVDTVLFRVKGTAFLYHQVRCLAAVLRMVGEGTEDPGVVKSLLDVDKVPRKPQYMIAPETPLLLSASSYDGLTWYRPRHALGAAMSKLSAKRQTLAAQAMLLKEMQELMEDRMVEATDAPGLKAKVGRHIPLLGRACEPLIEERTGKKWVEVMQARNAHGVQVEGSVD